MLRTSLSDMLGCASDLEFPERCALSFNAYKEVGIIAPHMRHTTYNIQRATCKEAIVNAPHVWQTTYNIKHTTRNSHSAFPRHREAAPHSARHRHATSRNVQHTTYCSM